MADRYQVRFKPRPFRAFEWLYLWFRVGRSFNPLPWYDAVIGICFAPVGTGVIVMIDTVDFFKRLSGKTVPEDNMLRMFDRYEWENDDLVE